MASRVHRASHSSMLKIKQESSFFAGAKGKEPLIVAANATSLKQKKIFRVVAKGGDLREDARYL